MKAIHFFKCILVFLKFLLTFADAITISTYTYLNNNDLSDDITINQNYFLALVNGNTEDFQHNLVVKGSLFIGDKNPADSGFTTTFTGSTLENDGLIVIDGKNLSSGSMTVSWSGSSITNNGKMYFNGLNSDSNSFTLDPKSSLTNNGLMYFGQDSSSGYSSSLQLKSNSFTNDGTICLKNVKAYLESSILGNGCITIGENTVYAIQSDSRGTLGSQTLYMTSPSSMIYVDSYGVTNNIHVRGFGNNNYLTFGTSIVRHSYNSDTGVLYFSVFLFISHKINIGTGYNSNGFSMTTISNHIGSRLANNALVYRGSDPNGKPSACMVCDSSSWIPVISIPSSSSLPTSSSVFSSSSIISTLSTVTSSSFISSSSSSTNFSPYPSSSFSFSTTSTTAIVVSFSTPSFFVSTVDISLSSSLKTSYPISFSLPNSSSDSMISSLLSSSTSTTSFISPNKSNSSDLLTVSLTSKATTSQDISSKSSSFANNITSINYSAVLPSSTSIRSLFISSSMSMNHTRAMESRAKTSSITTPISSMPSSHSTLIISSLFTSTAKTSHSQFQSSSIVSSVSLSSAQNTTFILASSSITSALKSSNIYNTGSKASIDPISRMHNSSIESSNKVDSTTTFSTAIKTSSFSSFVSNGHTAAPITKKDSSSVASSLPVFSKVSNQSRSTILFNSSSLWNKVTSDGMSTSFSSLTLTSTSKETHSVEYSGASSTSMTSMSSSVLSFIKSSSKNESIAKFQSTSSSTVTSFSVPSSFVSTVNISLSSDSRMSSLLSSSTSTTSFISPNKSNSSDLLTVSLTSKATTSQDISSKSSSFANNITSINYSAVLPSSTSIRSLFISSSMSMNHTRAMESRAKTSSITTPISSMPSSHSTLIINSLFTSTAKTSHSQLQSSSIVRSVSLFPIQTSASIWTSNSNTLVLRSSNVYNKSSKTLISLSLTSSSFLLSSLTDNLVSSYKSKALSSTIKDSDKNFTFTSIDPMSRMHNSSIESSNKVDSTTTFSTAIKTSSFSSFMSNGHTAAPITKKDSSSVASSLPVFSKVSNQSRSTILFNSSSLWNKVTSDGMSTSFSSLTLTSTSKETHSVEYSGASSTSMTSMSSSVLSFIKSSSKNESVAKLQPISASTSNPNISKVNVISHYSTYDTIVTTTTTASCPYSESDRLSNTLVVLTTVVVENESKKESSSISLVHPSYMAHTATLATLPESSYNSKSSTLSKAQIFNHSSVVLQSGNNGIILTETGQPKKKTTLAFTGHIESSRFRQKTQSIGTVHTTMTTTAITKTISLIDSITDVVRINTDSASQKITSSKSIYTMSTYMLQENANSGYKSQMFNSLLSIIVLYSFMLI